MIKNYLLIALRSFSRNRNYTVVNILGLAIGITSCIILFLVIRFDLSFDKFHRNYDRLYRVVREDRNASGVSHEAITPYPFAGAFRNDYPDIPLVTQFHHQTEGFLSVGNEQFQVENILFGDSLFFSVFDFEVVSGNPQKDLAAPNHAFLTESLAATINAGPGSRIRLDNKLDLEVVGIVKDPPANSHIEFSIVLSMASFTEEFFGWPVDRWGLNSAGFSYIVLPERIALNDMTTRLRTLVDKYYDKDEAHRITYHLQPLGDIHLNTTYQATPGSRENIDSNNLLIMGILGAFILIIACINFVNLATALAVKKSKEIGIRKTLGAKRTQLTFYFLGETLLITLIAVILSLGLVEWILPMLRNFIEKEIYLNLFSNYTLWLFLLSLVLIATVLSGFYPAIILSGFDPAAVLKNKMNATGSSGATVRKVLVIFQFIIAQFMIIATLVVTQQIDYLTTKPLGFSTDALLTVSLPDNDQSALNSFRSRMEANPAIKKISFGVGAPTSESNIGTGFFLEESGSEQAHGVAIKTVDLHYKDTYGIKMKSGRWFMESDERTANDTTIKKSERYSLILNETAAKKLGFFDMNDVLGKRIHIGLNDISAPVIGVTEDFHISSLREKIEPVVMVIISPLYFEAGIAVDTRNMSETIEFIKKTWTELFPGYYFSYEFLDEHVANLYKSEQRQLVLFRIFAGVSIFISCLGLLGLVSFMANQKLKEIGVRKVFGASVPTILWIFSKEFARLVFIAFVVAAPLSWFIMDKWLQHFEYRIDIHWIVYASGFIITLAIAMTTVAYRSIQAGLANPIQSLRSE
jgi:putative ABC transport system permease protein